MLIWDIPLLKEFFQIILWCLLVCFDVFSLFSSSFSLSFFLLFFNSRFLFSCIIPCLIFWDYLRFFLSLCVCVCVCVFLFSLLKFLIVIGDWKGGDGENPMGFSWQCVGKYFGNWFLQRLCLQMILQPTIKTWTFLFKRCVSIVTAGRLWRLLPG